MELKVIMGICSVAWDVPKYGKPWSIANVLSAFGTKWQSAAVTNFNIRANMVGRSPKYARNEFRCTFPLGNGVMLFLLDMMVNELCDDWIVFPIINAPSIVFFKPFRIMKGNAEIQEFVEGKFSYIYKFKRNSCLPHISYKIFTLKRFNNLFFLTLIWYIR